MTDIVRDLESAAQDWNADGEVWPGDLLAAAAREIIRLRAALDAEKKRSKETEVLMQQASEECGRLRTAPKDGTQPGLQFTGVERTISMSKAPDAPALTLGGLIEALSLADPKTPCVFDVGGSPSRPHSYRGDYGRLSFATGPEATVSAVLSLAIAALGYAFHGYKGGNYTATRGTLLHHAEWGACGREIVGIEQRDNRIVILTQDED